MNPVKVLSKLLFLFLRKFFIRTDVRGKENIPKRGPILFLSRHYHGQNDIILLESLIWRNIYIWVCIETFIQVKFKWIMDLFGWLPIKRNEEKFGKRIGFLQYRKKIDAYPNPNRDTHQKSLELLKRGNSILIFPEGDAIINSSFVPPEGDHRTPQKGFVYLARDYKELTGEDLTIIPIGIIPKNDRIEVTFGKMQIVDKNKSIEEEVDRIFHLILSLSSGGSSY